MIQSSFGSFLSRSHMTIRLAIVLLAIGGAGQSMLGSALLNQANVAAVKTVLVKDDRYLSAALWWYVLADPWLPGDEVAAPIMTASLRVADPCLAMRENDALLLNDGGAGRVRLALQGSCWWRQGEKDKAVQAWRQAGVESFLYNWARYDQAEDYVDRALDEYAALLAVNPASATGWLGLGSLYERMENWQQAEQAYEEATRVAPNNIMAHLEFAHYRFRGDLWISAQWRRWRKRPVLLQWRL